MDVEAAAARADDRSRSPSSEEPEGSAAACVPSTAPAPAPPDAALVVPKPVCPCLPFPRTGGYIGKHVWLCGPDHANVWPFKWMVGPDWPCMLLTYGLFIVPSVLFLVNVAMESHIAILIISIVLFASLLLAYTAAACTDPGIIRRPPPSVTAGMHKPEGFTLCANCNMYRPKGAYHCFDCDACFDESDHHCPWTGHCIAKRNLQMFNVFLGALCAQIGWLILVSLVKLAL